MEGPGDLRQLRHRSPETLRQELLTLLHRGQHHSFHEFSLLVSVQEIHGNLTQPRHLQATTLPIQLSYRWTPEKFRGVLHNPVAIQNSRRLSLFMDIRDGEL